MPATLPLRQDDLLVLKPGDIVHVGGRQYRYIGNGLGEPLDDASLMKRFDPEDAVQLHLAAP